MDNPSQFTYMRSLKAGTSAAFLVSVRLSDNNSNKISVICCRFLLFCVTKTVQKLPNCTKNYFMTITAILRPHKDKHDRQPVVIRITKGNNRVYKKTNIKVLADDFENGKVKETVHNHKFYNLVIKRLITEAEMELINPVSKFPDADFYKYCYSCFNQWDKTKASETLRQYTSEINKLKTFAPSVKLSNITPEWLNRYQAFCFAQKNTVNTVHKNLKFVRLIIRKAKKEGLLEKNPFDIFEMPKYKNPQKKYLTRDQVSLIEKLIYNKELPETVRHVAAWFCIGCYTGLRFSDMQQFNKKEHIINNRMILYTMKTGTPVSMPESDKLRKLFEEVNYKWVGITNIHYNRILKAIATICELGNLSAHQSRHTAAILWANSGISQEVTAKLLGHTDLKSTAIYYHITNLRIDDELKKLG